LGVSMRGYKSGSAARGYAGAECWQIAETRRCSSGDPSLLWLQRMYALLLFHLSAVTRIYCMPLWQGWEPSTLSSVVHIASKQQVYTSETTGIHSDLLSRYSVQSHKLSVGWLGNIIYLTSSFATLKSKN
jgi:hypothetical protein